MPHHTENGHMRLATTLVDALLASDLSKREWQVLMFLFRRTYNFRQTSCRATSTFIAAGTGLHASHVRAVLRDLEAAGCIEREGQMVLIRKAGFPIARGSKTPKRTETVRTETVRTKTVRQTDQNSPLNGPKQSTRSNTLSNTSTDPPYSPPAALFDHFWSQYPRKKARDRARKAFERLSKADQRAAIAALPDWPFSDDQQYQPHPTTWLNQRRWEDEPDAPSPPRINGHGHKRDPIAEWIARADRDAAAGEAAADHGEVVAQDGGDLWPGALALPRSRQQ